MRIGMVCPYSFDVHGGVQALRKVQKVSLYDKASAD